MYQDIVTDDELNTSVIMHEVFMLLFFYYFILSMITFNLKTNKTKNK